MGPVRRTYKGYTFADMTTEDDDGRFKARAAIMSLDGSRTRFQRFLDLETFKTRHEASERVHVAAMAWIDSDIGRDRLALPTNFGVFE
jgi:hypothetical protein